MQKEVRSVVAICRVCGGAVETRTASIEQPYSFAVLSGLRNVYLVGIKVSRCAACDTESPTIPRLGELNRVITLDLVHKPTPLTGSELRFLRKRAGISAGNFADLLRVDPSTLSRAENDKKALGPQSDRLARAIVVAEIEGGQKTVELLLNQAKEHKARTYGRKHQLTFARNRWTEAAA